MIQTSFGRSYLQLMMAKGLGLLRLIPLLLCWVPGFLLFQILCIVSKALQNFLNILRIFFTKLLAYAFVVLVCYFYSSWKIEAHGKGKISVNLNSGQAQRNCELCVTVTGDSSDPLVGIYR